MTTLSRTPNLLCRRSRRRASAPRAAFRFRTSASRSSLLAPRSSRPALTLIELLVTIVILVTLLAAVLPAVSPNNEGRKIREASRMLVSLFQQAQAQAARDGRPVGVGFNDTWNDADNDNVIDPGELTGIALEAYIIAEPPPFAGFSTGAAVVVMDNDGNPFVPLTPNTPTVNPGEPPIVNLAFGRGVGGEGIRIDVGEAIPPHTFRGAFMSDDDNDGNSEPEDNDGIYEPIGSGDLVEIGEELFELITNDCDDPDPSIPSKNPDGDTDSTPDTEDGEPNGYLKSQTVVAARWLSHRFRPVELLARGGKAYRIRRSPMAATSPSRTAAEAVQFPRGIGIDVDATEGDRIIGIVFSPNGAMDAVYQDGVKQDIDEPFFILLGKVENANAWTGGPQGELSPEAYDKYTFDGSVDDDVLAQRRREVNLLDPDSRWVTISPAGRIVASENAFFDPRQTQFVNGTPPDNDDSPVAQRRRQREAARQYAANYESEGGG
jgi:type II secretory pathway pseudopilin PulG